MNMGGGIYRLERGPLHFLCMCILCGCELSCFPFTFTHTCFIISTTKHTHFLPCFPLHLHTHASSFQPQNTHIFCPVFPFTFTHTCFIISTTKHPQFLPMCVCFSFAFADTCSSLFQPTIHSFSVHVCVFPLPMCCLSLFISQICLSLF